MEGLKVINGLECKIACASSKVIIHLCMHVFFGGGEASNLEYKTKQNYMDILIGVVCFGHGRPSVS